MSNATMLEITCHGSNIVSLDLLFCQFQVFVPLRPASLGGGERNVTNNARLTVP